MSLKAMLTRWVCDWFHGGGIIKRDPAGHINWQCLKCGAWGDPVSFDDEARVVDAALRREGDQTWL